MTYLTACGMIAAWVNLLTIGRSAHRFLRAPAHPLAGDAIAIAASLLWSGILFFSEQQVDQPIWPNLLSAGLIGVALYGVIAAFLVHGPGVLVPTAIALEIICLLVLVLIPFGFNEPSDWGFSRSDVLWLSNVYLLAVVGGTAAAFLSGWHKLGWLQLLSFVPSAFLIMLSEQLQTGANFW